MRNPFITMLFIVCITLGIVYDAHETFANNSSIDEVQEKRKAIQQEQSKKQIEIEQIVTEMEQLQEEIRKIELELVENSKKMETTEQQIIEYEKQFYILLDEIHMLNEAIEKRSDILKNRIVSFQENGGDITFLEVIFQSKSFIDFISRISSIATITNADQDLISQQTNDLELIEEHQKEIANKLSEQEQLMIELEAIEKSIKKQSSTLEQTEKELKEKETTLQKQVQQLRKEDSSLQDIEQSLKQRMESTINQSENEQTKQNDSTTKQNRSNNTVKSDGNKEERKVGKTFRMVATGYGPDCKGCSGYTATGMYIGGKNTPKVVAVDPNIIPLGTRVWVEGYGEAVAADTGGSIRGNKIDLLFPTEKEAAKQWGRRTVLVKILD